MLMIFIWVFLSFTVAFQANLLFLMYTFTCLQSRPKKLYYTDLVDYFPTHLSNVMFHFLEINFSKTFELCSIFLLAEIFTWKISVIILKKSLDKIDKIKIEGKKLILSHEFNQPLP